MFCSSGARNERHSRLCKFECVITHKPFEKFRASHKRNKKDLEENGFSWAGIRLNGPLNKMAGRFPLMFGFWRWFTSFISAIRQTISVLELKKFVNDEIKTNARRKTWITWAIGEIHDKLSIRIRLHCCGFSVAVAVFYKAACLLAILWID